MYMYLQPDAPGTTIAKSRLQFCLGLGEQLLLTLKLKLDDITCMCVAYAVPIHVENQF